MRSNIKYKKRQGQTLVEALVAIAITIMAATALVGLGVGAIRSATISKNRSQATSYAQEAMEAIRSIRDRGYGNLSTGGPYKLDWKGTYWGYVNGTETLDTLFTRYFTITQIDVGKLHISTYVSWTDSAGNHTLTLDTYLTNWR